MSTYVQPTPLWSSLSRTVNGRHNPAQPKRNGFALCGRHFAHARLTDHLDLGKLWL